MDKDAGQAVLRTKVKEINPLIAQILAILKRYLKNDRYRVFLYGSWASMHARPTSDIDIAILGMRPVTDAVFLKIREEIDNLPTLRSIDIVDLSRADRNFRDAVLRESEELCL
jgi:predicted nucleotidyltransferase